MTTALSAIEVRKLNAWIAANPDDCREYDVEDIVKRFGITVDDAILVYNSIQIGRPLLNPEVVFESWAHNIDPTELGRLVKEYIAESNHNGWDGFSRADKAGIRRLLTDMRVYFDNDDKDSFRITSSVNPL